MRLMKMETKKTKVLRAIAELAVVSIISLIFIVGGNQICDYTAGGEGETNVESARAVSYTHLTLPTIA